MYWDEEILDVEKNKYRKLSCYNLQDFILSANNLQTEQIYTAISDSTSQLSFTLYFKSGEYSSFDELKIYFAAYVISPIFKKNLKNIKDHVESKYNSTN